MTDEGAPPQSQIMDANALRAPPPTDVPQQADFGSIFEEEFNYVWNSLRRLGIPHRDLEDLSHDVFLRVFQQRDRYDAARPVRPWLFGFALRVAADYRRLARHRLEVLECDPETADPLPSALDHVVRTETLTLAQAALDSIEMDRRAVFILHILDGYSIPDIATALGLPLNTTYSRLRLAREQFGIALMRLRLRRGDP